MSLRFFTRMILPNTINKLQMLNNSVYNLKKTLPSVRTLSINLPINTHQSRRLYSEDAKLQEMIVDYDFVKNATTNKNILIVDVREPDEIKEHGKIPNSINIPLGNVSTALNSMSEKDFEQTYGQKKPSEDKEIIFYCMIGKRSGMAQQNAISFGYKNTKNYVGSWNDWASKNQ